MRHQGWLSTLATGRSPPPLQPSIFPPQRVSSSPCHCCPISSTLPSYHSPLGSSGASHKKPRPSQKASRVPFFSWSPCGQLDLGPASFCSAPGHRCQPPADAFAGMLPCGCWPSSTPLPQPAHRQGLPCQSQHTSGKAKCLASNKEKKNSPKGSEDICILLRACLHMQISHSTVLPFFPGLPGLCPPQPFGGHFEGQPSDPSSLCVLEEAGSNSSTGRSAPSPSRERQNTRAFAPCESLG